MTEVRKHQRKTASGKTTTVRHHTRDTGDGARAGWERRVASAQAAPAPHVSALAPAEPAGAEEPWWAEDEVCGCGHPPDEPCNCRCTGNHPGPRVDDACADCGHPLTEACGCRCIGDHPSAHPDAATEKPLWNQDLTKEDIRAQEDADWAAEGNEPWSAAAEPPPAPRAGPAPEPPAVPGRPDSPAFRIMAHEMRSWRAVGELEPGPGEPMSPEMARVLGCDTPEGLARYERGRAYREAGYDGPLDREGRIPDPDDPAGWAGLAMLADMRRRRG